MATAGDAATHEPNWYYLIECHLLPVKYNPHNSHIKELETGYIWIRVLSFVLLVFRDIYEEIVIYNHNGLFCCQATRTKRKKPSYLQGLHIVKSM